MEKNELTEVLRIMRTLIAPPPPPQLRIPPDFNEDLRVSLAERRMTERQAAEERQKKEALRASTTAGASEGTSEHISAPGQAEKPATALSNCDQGQAGPS